MKRILIVIAAIGLTAGCKTNEKVNASSDGLSNQTDSLSYALGVSIGESLKDQGVDELNYDMMAQGMEAQFADASIMTAEDADGFIRGVFNEMRLAKEEEAKAEGLAWLEENKGKEGVQTSDSGLQYKILQEGNGTSPTASDQVTVHYEGRLIDGTVFDSSYERGEPATFPLSGVIPGWTEGLQYLSEGGKAELYIPSDLGYGARPAPGGKIPAHSTLIFTVELISVNN